MDSDGAITITKYTGHRQVIQRLNRCCYIYLRLYLPELFRDIEIHEILRRVGLTTS